MVLSRKKRQKIHIGDNIIIEVLEVYRNKVRIGITAPKDISIKNQDDGKEIVEDASDNSGK